MTERAERELLELAAKAVGLTLRWIGDEPSVPYTPEESAQRNGVDGYMWNPLTKDGDALRLAVKLGIGVIPDRQDRDMPQPMPSVWTGGRWHIFDDTKGMDPAAATRRAIVRAAAEIGAKP